MPTASARPERLADFDREVTAAQQVLADARPSLANALHHIRSGEVLRWVGAVPRYEDDVAALAREDHSLAGWVGRVGAAFAAADDGELVRSTDATIETTVDRLGDGDVTIRVVDGEVIVDAGSGDDEISVEERDGDWVVVVNGEAYDLPDGSVTIRGGGGHDTITLPRDVEVRFTLDGGDGDDRITGSDGRDVIYGSTGNDTIEALGAADRVDGGDGRDYIDGSSGNDTLIGGRGHDTIYGGDGVDRVLGGQGRDYLDGGQGNDKMFGGRHADVVSGGHGDDHLAGGRGDDVIYGGTGGDEVLDLAGSNTAYVETGDRLDENSFLHTARVTVDLSDLPSGSGIRIEGSPEFVQRVEADLATLASSPTGLAMLAAMDDINEQTKAIASDWPLLGRVAYQGDVVVIKEYDEPNGAASYTDYWLWRNNSIDYNPRHDSMYDYDSDDVDATLNWREVPPVVILQHELAHQYDYGYETRAPGDYAGADDPGVPNREREAVGLPLDDGNLAPGHPFIYTENGLRVELGLPERGSYGNSAP